MAQKNYLINCYSFSYKQAHTFSAECLFRLVLMRDENLSCQVFKLGGLVRS